MEDDVSIALLSDEELTSSGFSVVHHETVETALKCIQKMQPAAVVVDLILQDGETGWELIGQMKKLKDTESIPIIISSSVEKDPRLMEKFHVDHYLTKPYPLHDFSATIIQNIHRSDGRILYPQSDHPDKK
ncbi:MULTISPECIES: response regulator [unclassified Sporosarcina]|uniref:response regulator n=1 Tax=unclassified Sporosarcina TaxID=2647733 RepID=UPI00203ED9CE|nr:MULTISPECIES: response regulator [unclassified Sporosarcina]